MFILAILSSVALLIMGIKHAIFLVFLPHLMNLIPYVGPLIAAVLPISYALLTTDSLFYPFAIFMAFNLIQILESNLLTPKIVGSNVSLNPLVTFLALLIGGTIWGVIGMILFIPTTAILKKLFELSEATAPYAFLMGDEKTKKTG
jgi:predicted PurR-regulated permease PerM